jgi:thiamine biosynthesis lipoprotein
MRSRWIRLATLILACAPLVGAEYLGSKQMERSRNFMGETLRITVFQSNHTDESLGYVLEKAFLMAGEIEKEVSPDDPESVPSRVSRAKSGEAVELNEDMFRIVKEGIRFSRLTEGAVDITSGGLRQLWRKAKEQGEPPSEKAVKEALPSVRYEDIRLDEYGKKLVVERAGLQLDLGSVARGYLLDKVAGFLDRNEVRSAVISYGGNILMVGLSPGSAYWKVGIEHPRKVEEHAVLLELSEGRAISTVGDYESFFLYKSKRYPHLFNANTGYPAQNRVSSVTVIAKDATISNVLSEALFVMGPERGFELIEKMTEEAPGAIYIEERSEKDFTLAGSDGVQPFIKDIRL